jgi:hypothetical protein
MTKQEHLRRYLASAGFTIKRERFSYDSGKYYVTMVAEYCGELREISFEEAELGIEASHDEDRVEYLGFLEGKRKATRTALLGKAAGGYDAAVEEERLGIIEKRIAKLAGV